MAPPRIASLTAPIVLASAFLFASPGCGDDATDGSGGAGAGHAGTPLELDFASPACLDELCWVAPVPQGNRLRAADTASDGTTYAVGDHGTVLRWDGERFAAAGLPRSAESLWTSRPQLLAVHARTPDDVWIAGTGGVVLRLGPEGLTDASPTIAANARFVAVHAFAADDVWLVSAAGTVLHFDGATWSTSLALPTSGALVGMWAASEDDVWVFGQKAAGVAVAHHFDGSAWSELAVTPASDGSILPAGAPVAVTGSAAGEPRFAFEHQLVAIGADGSPRRLWASPSATSFPPSPVVGATTDREGSTWLAFDAGATVRVDDAGTVSSAANVVATGFGAGPDGRVLLLRRGGGLGDPTATAAPRRAIDPIASNGSCAAAGEDVVCLTASPAGGAELKRFPGTGGPGSVVLSSPTLPDTALIAANASGLTAVGSNYTELLVVDPQGAMRTLSLPGSQIASLAVTDDGSVYVGMLDCTFGRVLPGQSTFTNIARTGGTPAAESSCAVAKVGPSEVYLTALGDMDASERWSIVVRSADGSLLHDVRTVEALTNFPIVAVTASGVPYYAGRPRDSETGVLYRLEGGGWTKLAFTPSTDAKLVGRGDRVYLSDSGPDDGSLQAVVHVIDAGGSLSLQLPVGGIASMLPTTSGFFGTILDVEPSEGGFASTSLLALFRVTPP
jgi:hypothetical protein